MQRYLPVEQYPMRCPGDCPKTPKHRWLCPFAPLLTCWGVGFSPSIKPCFLVKSAVVVYHPPQLPLPAITNNPHRRRNTKLEERWLFHLAGLAVEASGRKNMFDMLASKLGEAQAFADGLAVNLDVINMDRLLEEQEREEKSKAESLRLLRNTGDTTTDAPPGQASSEAGAAEAAGRAEMRDDRNRVSGGALGEIEIPQLRTDEEQGESKQERSLLFSPDGAASEGGGGLSNSFAAMEDGGGNFEDEFDPILASIRKPPQRQQPARTAAAAAAAATATANKSPPAAAVGGERKEDSDPSPVHDAGRPSAGSTFAAGFLSMLPGDMRAKAGEVMAQSSVRISESADAIRSALESGRVAAPAPADKFKRRQSDGGGGNPDLEDGRGGGKGGRRAAGGEGDDDEVRLLNVNELLSEEERQQLAAYSGGAGGGAGRFCGWRRLRKYIPVAVGIGLLGLFYLWRWGALLGDNANGVVALGSERV